MSNEQTIWQYLKGKGLNDYAVAGIMGNLYAESGLRPDNPQNTYEKKLGLSDAQYTAAVDNGSYTNFVRDSAGYGLAQWTYWTRKQNLLARAQAAGVSIANLQMQLNYLWEEITANATITKELKAADSVRAASNTILLKFERPADQSETAQKKRASYGQTYYDKYAGAGNTQKQETESEGESMSKAQQAVNFAVAVAKDNTHGYDQVDRWGNPNYDCSGLVITAYEHAGVPVKTNGATYTGNMHKVFLKTGFTDIIGKVNVAKGTGLEVGDVLLHQGKHTALYIGGGQIVHASINEKGTATGGKSGDQTGHEICTRSYYNHPWDSVLRYTQDTAAVAGFNAVGTVTVTGSAVNVRKGGGTSYGVIAVAHKGDVLQYDGTQQNGWYHVTINGVTGYISNNYSKPNTAAGFTKKVTCTGNGVRICKGGGTGYAILISVNKGTVMYWDNTKQNGWYHVKYGNTVGYMHPGYIKVCARKS